MNRNAMMHFYKSRVNFGNTGQDKKRKEENDKLRLVRKDRRTQMFNVRRSISAEEEAIDNMAKSEENNPKLSEQKKLLDRKIALEKYKQKKEVIKQVLNQKKKPPFVVGIPHHGNSPVLKEINTANKSNGTRQIGPKPPAGNQRFTRAKSKLAQGGGVFVPKSPVRMFPFNDRKSVFAFQLNKGAGLKKLTSPHTPTVLKRSAQKNVRETKEKAASNLKKGQFNNKPVVKLLKSVLQVKKKTSTSSSDSGQSLAAPLPKSDAISDLLETKNKEESISPDKQDIPNISPIDSVAEEESESDDEVTFQRERVNNESGRLLSLAEEWERVSLNQLIPQDVIDEIDSVVGQTRLLTRDKFKQFCGLIEQYQTQKGSNKITLEDLNGFWDMVYLQVESLNKKFSHLEVLKVNNWEEPKPDIPRKKRKRSYPKRKPKKPDSGVENFDPVNIVDQPSSTTTRNGVARRSRRSRKNVQFKQGMENIPVDSPTPADTIEELVACTPRRSVRLAGKIQTPSSPKCFTCRTPDCDSFHCARKSEKENTPWRSSRLEKSVTSSVGPDVENTSKGSPPFGNAQAEEPIEENRISKRFTLKPSKLILNESANKSPLPKKAIKPFGVKNENSLLPTGNMDSCSVRRSTRIHSAKKVTFDSSFEDKSNLKLPATPYSRKGFIQDTFSDSFSE